MKSIDAVSKTIEQQMAARIGAQRVAEPFMAWYAELMRLSATTVVMVRHGDTVTMTTSWPPEVQEAMDRCTSLCKQAVSQYLRQEGFTLSDSVTNIDAIS